VLAPIVGDELGGEIEASDTTSLREAMEDRWPGLTNHLFDSTGAQRPHVLCFIDDASDRLDGEPRALADGSVVRIVQAVSGG
jgi:hypothetical protein